MNEDFFGFKFSFKMIYPSVFRKIINKVNIIFITIHKSDGRERERERGREGK